MHIEVFADTFHSTGIMEAGLIRHISKFYLAGPLIGIGIVALLLTILP
jgi:hypothetical protein